MSTDSCSPFTDRDYKLGLSRKEVSKIFREGNKLVDAAVSGNTCPLGDVKNSIRKFRAWAEDLPHYMFYDYFENLYQEQSGNVWAKYTRPIMRGRDGQLWSAQDMDNAMMNH